MWICIYWFMTIDFQTRVFYCFCSNIPVSFVPILKWLCFKCLIDVTWYVCFYILFLNSNLITFIVDNLVSSSFTGPSEECSSRSWWVNQWAHWTFLLRKSPWSLSDTSGMARQIVGKSSINYLCCEGNKFMMLQYQCRKELY